MLVRNKTKENIGVENLITLLTANAKDVGAKMLPACSVTKPEPKEENYHTIVNKNIIFLLGGNI